jgi:hypothetical protein
MPEKLNTKTHWPKQMKPQDQVNRVLNALLANIGPDSIKGLSVFVFYEDENGESQKAIFTGGEQLDEVQAWAKSQLNG